MALVSKLANVPSISDGSESTDRDLRTMRFGNQLEGALTARQCDTLQLISEGFSNKSIARILGISPETVKSHVKHIFAKLAVSTRAAAVARATLLGAVDVQKSHQQELARMSGWTRSSSFRI
jgi:DNA-binding CsgD family transcriptional regulator